MKKINLLIIGPKHGGIGWYLKQLHHRLKKLNIIKRIDWYGYSFLTFNLKMIDSIKEKDLPFSIEKYDIIHFEFGTYDIEQVFLPILAKKKTINNRFLLTIHNLDWELAKKIKRRSLQHSLHRALKSIDGFLFFGSAPVKHFKNNFRYLNRKKFIISYHPSTYENYHISHNKEKKILTKYQIKKPYLAFFGYPAKWKNYKLLLKSFEEIKMPISFYFIGKWWKEKLGFQHKFINNVKIRVIDREMSERDFFVCIKNSLFGVFSYSSYPTFQCSGILPIFINLGKSVVATKAGTIFEYVDKGGILTPLADPKKFGQSIDKLISDSKVRHDLELKTKLQAKKISWKQHIKSHLELYKKILRNKSR